MQDEGFILIARAFFGGFLLALGLFEAVIAVLHIQQKIAPNRYVGIRVRKTLNNPAIWYEVHRKTGWAMLCAGGMAVIGGVAIFACRKAVSNDLAGGLFFVLTVFPLLGAAVYGLCVTWRTKLPPAP